MDAADPIEASTSALPFTTNGDDQGQQDDAQKSRPSTPLLPETIMQKRVLPTRSRRGGPGVGSSEIDLSILDAQRRAEENKPLIPPTTHFLLVTDPTRVPPPVDITDNANGKRASSSLYQSYFDRPEVARSFREQQLIETPVFSTLPKDAVGGRLRARTGDEDHSDTGDGAYIARHRKYETFEKRQRRREKEKLAHEHHKLKTRMEQLRSMDVHAFGGKDAEESERRRQAMLATAEDLEQRYRVLLPEPRHKVEKKAPPKLTLSESDEEPVSQPSKRLTIKISRPAISVHHPASPSRSRMDAVPRRKKGRPRKNPIATLPNGEPSRSSLMASISGVRISTNGRHHQEGNAMDISETRDIRDRETPYVEIEGDSKFSPPTTSNQDYTRSPSGTRLIRAQSGESDGDPPTLPSHIYLSSVFTDFVPSGRGRRPKRPRFSVNRHIDPEISWRYYALNADPATCALLRQAMRTDPSARKTRRTHEPLGAKVGPRVEETIDYEAVMRDTLLAYRSQVKFVE